ncbi:hypothetical protein PHLCEN_2v4443 [Hermanssonia centrifuga]|uniref:Uncharacterized protein n=1 Tax=Hermanssonia centrifuga TaxID=98765 RepID=A0A2R6PNI7_9APHY|nr:hypothetical protein PHLCEN_2v4443 [Hermanssonia centrifuga]
MANAGNAVATGMDNWIGRLIAQMASHYDNAIVSLAQQVTGPLMTVQTQQALVVSYKRQVDALPTSAEIRHSRQPKIGEPPSFRRSDNKTKLDEWLNLIILWCEHEGVATDKQDDKEGTKKEITALFTNKDLASKDFVKYAERFRTLGQLTGYDNELHIDKLREVLPRDMRLVLAGKNEAALPTEWTKFLDVLLNINKIANSEKSRGTVFSKGGSNDRHSRGCRQR